MSKRANKILQNTGFLYVRMLFTLLIALYTSRVLLKTLGVEDYGLYHVIMSFIFLAGFLQSSLSTTTQRFIAFELGKSKQREIGKIFSMSINIHIIFALVLFILIGALGSGLIPSVLTFDKARSAAVFIVFWLLLSSFIVNILALPSQAMVIAHEKMKVFAWVSIFDVLLKLAIVFLTQWLPYDPLITYGTLFFVVTLLTSSLYVVYVHFDFPDERYKPGWDATLCKRLISFSGWTIWGNTAAVFSNHGSNVLLNIFFGPAVNAAKSISSQASGAINQFVTNLQLAINPQLIKSYSGDDHVYSRKLINYGSKYNYFLVYTLALPLLFRTEDVLNLWLVEPPEFAAIFLRLMLLNILIDSLSRPLMTAAQATGRIKLYQAVVGGLLLLHLPIAYVALKSGFGAESVFVVAVILTSLAGVARIVMLKRILDFSFKKFLRTSLLRALLVSGVTTIISHNFANWFGETTKLCRC